MSKPAVAFHSEPPGEIMEECTMTVRSPGMSNYFLSTTVSISGHTLSRYLKLFPMIAILTGCTIYQPKPLVPEDSSVRFATRSLDDSGLHHYIETITQIEYPEWPRVSWGLGEFTLAAFYFNPDLDVARATWGVAEAAKISAGERPNPTVVIGPAKNTDTSIPSPWILQASLDVPFETFGKRDLRVVQASQLSESARHNLANVAWQVRNRIRSGLLNVYSTLEQETLLREQQTIQQENLQIQELQYLAGNISVFELTQARLATENARIALRNAERQTIQARVQFAGVIGIPVISLDTIEFDFESLLELPEDIPEIEYRRLAMLNRTDILASLSDYEASQTALQLEITRQYPDIQIGPGFEYDQGDNKWSLGLTSTLPIFTHNRGGIAEAEAMRVHAAAQFNALQANVLTEIESAISGYKYAMHLREDMDQMFEDLRSQEELAQLMFDVGDISRGELVSLRLQRNTLELDQFNAQVQLLEVAGQMENALQIPLRYPKAAWESSSRGFTPIAPENNQ